MIASGFGSFAQDRIHRCGHIEFAQGDKSAADDFGVGVDQFQMVPTTSMAERGETRSEPR